MLREQVLQPEKARSRGSCRSRRSPPQRTATMRRKSPAIVCRLVRCAEERRDPGLGIDQEYRCRMIDE